MLVPSMQYSLPVDETKKRLQIRVSDGEYQVILNAARKKGMTVSQWVREALRIALGFEAESEMTRKLEAIPLPQPMSLRLAALKQCLQTSKKATPANSWHKAKKGN